MIDLRFQPSKKDNKFAKTELTFLPCDLNVLNEYDSPPMT